MGKVLLILVGSALGLALLGLLALPMSLQPVTTGPVQPLLPQFNPAVAQLSDDTSEAREQLILVGNPHPGDTIARFGSRAGDPASKALFENFGISGTQSGSCSFDR